VIGAACAFLALHFLVFFAAPFGGWRPLSLTARKFDHEICLIGTCERAPVGGVLCAQHAAENPGRVRRSGTVLTVFALVLVVLMTGRLVRRYFKIVTQRSVPGSGEPRGALPYVASQLLGPILLANIAGWMVLWGIQPS
jgi:hypothetical protein